MASILGSTSRAAKVAADSAIQRCSSSTCFKVKILSAVSLTGVVRKAVPVSVGFIVVDIGDICSFSVGTRFTAFAYIHRLSKQDATNRILTKVVEWFPSTRALRLCR